MLAVLMPPQIEQKGMALHIKCYGTDGLPRMDDYIGGTCDPYCKVEYAGITLKTKHGTGYAFNWNEEMLVPVMEPIMSSNIRMSVYDWDRVRIRTHAHAHTPASHRCLIAIPLILCIGCVWLALRRRVRRAGAAAVMVWLW